MQLQQPSPELARQILSDVPYEDRLTAYKMRHGPGPQRRRLYSLEETSEFLSIDDGDTLQQLGGKGSVTDIDFVELQDWVAEVIGDQELAAAIHNEIVDADCYREKLQRIQPLLKLRVEQSKKVVNIHGD